MVNYYFNHANAFSNEFVLCLWFFHSEQVAEPGRYGDPRTKAHSSSAKKTVQDGEFLF